MRAGETLGVVAPHLPPPWERVGHGGSAVKGRQSSMFCFITAMLGLLASAPACTAQPTDTAPMMIEAHGGLRFGVPAGRVVEAHGNRLVLKPAALKRSVDEIVIWTAPPPALPAGKVMTSDNPAPHSLVTADGGMGGPEYTLSIPKPLAGQAVTLRAHIQSEAGQPAFAEAWAVWRSIEVGQ